jgi:glucose-6-phosphate 1-dehydrogenase
MAANNIPTVLIVFGATGDLMHKKIGPSLFHLYRRGKLPAMFRVIGVARRPLTHDEFRALIVESLATHKEFKAGSEMARKFLERCFYQQGGFAQEHTYEQLSETLGRVDGEWNVCSNKLFYLAVPPMHYETIFRHLSTSGLTIPCGPDEGWTRVLVEKPFGQDAKTAAQLDELLSTLFREEQIYRIDHYLAKEMLQNILSFRFSNNLLEQSWNGRHIEKITVRLLEKDGIEGRGAFYDRIGALRDVGQNHLLQMMAFVMMEQPAAFTAEDVRTKRAKVLRELVVPSKQDVVDNTYRAQYIGYRDVEGVLPDSQTETYFRVKTSVNNPNWKNVPILLEAGKAMKQQVKEIIVTFKHTSPCLCPPDVKKHLKNRVIFALEPKEKIAIHFMAKKPGLDMEIEPRKIEFSYRSGRKHQYVAEYEKLLLDCIEGNQLLFVNTEEVQAMWRFTDPIVSAWENDAVKLETYKQHSIMKLKPEE